MSRARTIEIVGRYDGERFSFASDAGNVIIGSVRLQGESKEIASQYGIKDPYGSVTIKGDDDGTLEPMKTYRFIGSFSTYTNRRTGLEDRQFHFRTFVPHVPHDADGLVQYLTEVGKGNGIGPSKARKIVDTFGADEVLMRCRKDPETVASLVKIDLELAQRFANKLEAQKATENAKLEIDRLLSGRKFPRSLSTRLIKEWGNKAAEIITDDPFRLMQFKGVGFKLADNLYLELGKDPASIDRQALFLWYLMDSDNAGHCWFSAENQIRTMRKNVGFDVDYRGAILRGREFGQIDPKHYGAISTIRTNAIDGAPVADGGCLWLADGKVAQQEELLASLIAKAATESTSTLLTLYDEYEVTESIPASVARCFRCGRALTADEVFILNGMPYGPTCIGKVG